MKEYFIEISDELFYKQINFDYGKTKNDIDEYEDILLEWIKNQRHLPEITPRHMVRFALLATKFSIEKCKQKIDMYYTIKSLMPEIFSKHPLSPEMIFQSQVMYCIPLPRHTDNLHRILYASFNPEYGPEYFDHESIIVQLNHVIEFIIQEDKCYNFQIIFELGAAKVGHVPRFSPIQVKKILIILEKVYANRVAAIYLVNLYPFIEHILNVVFLRVLPDKMRNRVKILRSTDELLEKFGKYFMPKDIGGEEKSLAELRERLIEKYQEWKPRFDKIQHMKVDESLRSEELKNDDILGYYGSFKHICVD